MMHENHDLTDSLFRLFVSSVVDYALILLDPDGKIVTWNAGAQRIKGYEAKEIIGKHFSVFYTQEDLFIGKPQKELHEAKKHGSVEDLGWRVRKDGSRFFANVTITPLFDEKSNLVGFAKVTRDVTERRLAEEQLQKSKVELEMLNTQLADARNQAEKVSKLKSEFVANVSHEIRTPLSGIIGLSNVLLKTELNSQQLRCLESIRTAGSSLLVVINDILDFSKIEAGKLDLQMSDFSPLALIESACELLEVQAKSKHLSISSSVSPNIPYAVRGDPERLRQILVNLVSNAVKFSESGEISVKAELDGKHVEHIFVRFSVTDHGIGLNQEECKKLFRPFTQSDGSVSRKYGGTGLGLSISKSLAELMNGEIGVESEKGKGTEFWFRVQLESSSNSSPRVEKVPLIAPPKLAIEEETPFYASRSPARKTQSASSAADLAETKKVACEYAGLILVVEDHEINQQVAQFYLEELGCSYHVVENGNKALKALAAQHYDLILMDCQMPEMDGLTATSLIRQNEKNSSQHIPIIAMTAHAMDGYRKSCLEAGMDDYISKPVELEELRRLIHKWLPVIDPQIPHEFENLIDFVELNRRYKERTRQMLEMFMEEAPRQVASLKKACESKDRKEIFRCAHGFKGICGALLITKMRALCLEAENAARNNDLTGTNSLMFSLENLCRQVQRQARHHNYLQERIK